MFISSSPMYSQKIEPYLWEAERLSEALENLGRKAGLLHRTAEVPQIPDDLIKSGKDGISQWMKYACQRAGIECVSIESSYRALDTTLSRFSPGLVEIFDQNSKNSKFLLCLKSKKDKVQILKPDLSVTDLNKNWIHSVLVHKWEDPLSSPVEEIVDQIGVASARKKQVKQNILKEQLGNIPIGNLWMLRMNPGVHPLRRMMVEKVPYKLGGMLIANILVSILGIASWSVIGLGAFHGKFEWVWLMAWALILLTIIPFQLVSNWFSSLLSIKVGAIFKERLIYGILRLPPDDTKSQGVGQFMGRVMDSEAVKRMAMGGGLMVFYSITQLFVALGILLIADAGLLAVLFILWFLIGSVIGWRYYTIRHDFTVQYRFMTNDLVERMVGHRTRLAQESKENWHKEEDHILSRYIDISEKLDAIGTLFQSIIPRGWLLIGLGGFTYSFILQPENELTLGLMLGGIMVASKAFSSLVEGMMSMFELIIAWKQFEPIFDAGKETVEDLGGSFNSSNYFNNSHDKTSDLSKPTLIIRDVTFRYQNFGKAVIESGNMDISTGDRVLIKGSSGGGKSTLASLITCIRKPQSGLIFFNGMDRETLGADAWRGKVVMVPQFHENYILTETLAFNLLMGRNWPPHQEDLREAQEICEELGLGELIRRMPSGFQQMIGESGWRLSHGEKSRVFIARALLQKAEVLLLDESFGALDPMSLKLAMASVMKRAKSLIVIAHP